MAGPDRLLMICVKARAYGHGLVPVAKAALAGGADRLCVAYVDEGVELRQAGIKCPIQLLLEPQVSSAADLHHYNLIPTLSSPKLVQRLSELLTEPLTIQVEVDTGMTRVDLKPKDVVSFLNMVKSTGKFKVEGIFSHFSNSHVANDPVSRVITLNQLKSFLETLANCRKAGHQFALTHIASSGAVVHYPEAYLDMIRSGFLVHGIPRSWIHLPLKPALSWKSRVKSVFKVSGGQGVGYERSYITPHNTTLATVACGYADGYPHQLSSGTEVLIQGRRARVVGRVGMNQMVVDVDHIDQIEIGNEVVLIGTQGENSITANDLAKQVGTTPADIVCKISMCVPRVYLSDLSENGSVW